MSSVRPMLIIMAKAPMMGRAKTRLARDIGVTHAQRLYRMMMSQVLRQTDDPRWETVLAVTPISYLGRAPIWRGYKQVGQVNGSLTPRLAAVLNRKGPTVVIGTDCPEISACDIADAFKAIKKGKAVLGPADDGGFWLIGMNGPAPRYLFEDVRWSHEETLKDMEARFKKPVAYLRTLVDVDDFAALKVWKAPVD